MTNPTNTPQDAVERPKLDLSNVEKLIAEATPGPWAVDSVLPYAVSPAICECFGLKVAGKNAALIALAPDLAAEVLRLSKEVEELRDQLEELRGIEAQP